MMITYQDGKIELHKIKNDCQMWRVSKDTFMLHPDVRIVVKTDNGEVYKDLTYVQSKRGMLMVNSVKKLPHEEELKKSVAAVAATNAEPKTERKKGCIFICA